MFKTIISWITAIVLAIVGFFGGLFGIGDKKPPEPTAPTTAVTAPATTEEPTTEPVTEEPTTEEPTEPELPASQTFQITLAGIQALGLEVYECPVVSLNSVGTSTNRVYTGVRVKDVLEALGANIAAINEDSTLTMTTTDNFPAPEFDYDIIISDLTLLAWTELTLPSTTKPYTVPRFCPCGTTGVNEPLFIKQVNSITITY